MAASVSFSQDISASKSNEIKLRGVKVLALDPGYDVVEIEQWCRKMTRLSRQTVEWYVGNGKTRVKVVGNLERAAMFVLMFMNELSVDVRVYWNNVPYVPYRDT